MAKLNDFERGVLYAAAILQITHDETMLAAVILRESGLTDADCTELDDIDKQALCFVNIEKDINIKGLG